ncbi:MAG: type VI secretion system tip protein VgrG [Deltaproteobacteria bacterium]|nr:type VI secretion system tip protein VgrG [Deltaproteobacteria bacterium]
MPEATNAWPTAKLTMSGLDEITFVFAVEGHEALGWPFELVVDFAIVRDTAMTEDELQAVLDGTVTIMLGEAEEDGYCGIFRSIELLSSASSDHVVYRGILVPRLWLASQTARSRVFLELSVADIVKTVLTDTGMALGDDFTLQTDGISTVQEFVMQFEETDLAFVNRLLEHGGAYYHFTHTTLEKMEIVTASSSAPALMPQSTIPYDPHGRAIVPDRGGGCVFALTQRRRSVPKQVELREYNYRTPALDLRVETPVDATSGRGWQHRYGDHYKDVAAGKALMKVRAEEIMATRTTYHGRSNVRSLRAGVKMTVEGAPADRVLDAEYLILEVRQSLLQAPEGSDGENRYENEFVAIKADVPFRPPRITPRPRIHGIVPAKVDGEATGTKAPIDDQGRYKVAFPFDVVAAAGGKATRWIRMAQPFAGQGYGFHIPLHIGTEVLVAFVEGDPDRPVILGAAPNHSTTPPVVDANATQSVVRTRAAIHIELEDDAT